MLLSVPQLEHCHTTRLEHEHRLGLVVLAEEVGARGNRDRRGLIDEELQHVGANAAEDRHALEGRNPSRFHGLDRAGRGRQANMLVLFGPGPDRPTLPAHEEHHSRGQDRSKVDLQHLHQPPWIGR